VSKKLKGRSLGRCEAGRDIVKLKLDENVDARLAAPPQQAATTLFHRTPSIDLNPP
jgi:hypothetical protein